eukprot:CAMPEP_0181183130 /NCGR_PEP_ID=MMETSP1096-20121128/8257_1 /TAXON_ID=156174 ORGANISM="Chrysochromulina ericina, Strain CCMP281" /NCGR_SAMPLE_ID=MMETSP1096 /ASSEMBLY_ACC=CAM_ASM_000453 /LENGTH=228 /DNA_ID=CAMNT_0023271781 /DNA_START=13 /DNA_END=697 /DNA_ORIENTATION=+
MISSMLHAITTPAATHPAATDPATTDPAVTDPATTDPATDPAAIRNGSDGGLQWDRAVGSQSMLSSQPGSSSRTGRSPADSLGGSMGVGSAEWQERDAGASAWAGGGLLEGARAEIHQATGGVQASSSQASSSQASRSGRSAEVLAMSMAKSAVTIKKADGLEESACGMHACSMLQPAVGDHLVAAHPEVLRSTGEGGSSGSQCAASARKCHVTQGGEGQPTLAGDGA